MYNKLNIAFFVKIFPAISETFILRQITGLIDCGHNVDIYAQSLGGKDQAHPEIEKYNLWSHTIVPRKKNPILYRLLHIPICARILYKKNVKLLFKAIDINRFGWSVITLKTLYDIVQYTEGNTNYDIIHAHFGPNGNRALYVREDLKLLKAPIVTTFHGYDVNVLPINDPKIYERLGQFGELFTANSKYIIKKVEKLGIPPDKLIQLPVGLPINEYPFQRRKKRKHVRILSIGRLVPGKGFEYGLRAFAKVANKYSNVYYTIIGDGQEYRALKQLSVQLGIQSSVTFTGKQRKEKVQEWLYRSDIFLFPSITSPTGWVEGQGLALQEAQASGLPVVASNSGGIPEGLLDGKSGFLIAEKDVDGIADRLEYLVQHSNCRYHMGEIGSKFVIENYNIDRLNEKLMQIYKKAIERRKH